MKHFMDVSVLLINIVSLFIAEMGSGLVTQRWRTGFNLLLSGFVCSFAVMSLEMREYIGRERAILSYLTWTESDGAEESDPQKHVI